MALFRFLHLTDFHFCLEHKRKNVLSLQGVPRREIIDTVVKQRRRLGSKSFLLPVSYDVDIAKGIAQFCSEWSDDLDGIIITGDLATTGLPVDIEIARKFILDPIHRGFLTRERSPTIAQENLPIHLFAGNHDRYLNNWAKPTRRSQRASVQFDIVFETLMDKRSQDIGSWVDEKEGSEIAFVHADFSLRKRGHASMPAGYYAYGQGKVYAEVLTALSDETFAIKKDNPKAPIIWLVHFAPYECESNIQLLDHRRLMNAAAALDVSAIICGHTHRMLFKKEGSQVIYCGGSACCVDNHDGCMLHLFEFDVGQSLKVSRATYVWSDQRDEFIFHSHD